MEKHAPDGSLLWLKRYDVSMYPEDVLALPDAYVIFGKMADNRWGLLKTDKDGNPLIFKTLNTSTALLGNTLLSNRQGQMVRISNHLLMTDHGPMADDPNAILLLKTDFDLGLDNACDLLQTESVIATTMPAKTAFVPLTRTKFAASISDAGVIFVPDSFLICGICPACPCCAPDLTLHVDSIGCSITDGIIAHLSVCNLGEMTPDTGFHLTFYGKNPLLGAAVALQSVFFAEKPTPGVCMQMLLPLDAALLQQSQIFTLVGADGNVPTPVSLSSFPFSNGYAECDYANNLDSFATMLPPIQKPDLGPDRSICQGQTATLEAGNGYASYQWLNGPATQTFAVSTAGNYIAEVTDACGRVQRDTVQVTVSPKFETTQTITFYPGDTIVIDGKVYTESGTVVQNFTTSAGCDSVVTNILQLVITEVNITCPANLTVTLPPNQTSTVVDYSLPTVTTNCPDSTIKLTLLQGLPVGGNFPQGTTQVCYEAANQCGIRDTCCFTITAELPDSPCDVKAPTGCIRYDLLSIRLDSIGQRRYRVRMTNTCPSPLEFAYIQMPNGVGAVSPANNATYTAPGGNTYTVRNPNASPFYSIRYKAVVENLNNGESDVFEYTLPQQSQPAYIHVAAKLTDGTYSEAHLNTYNCPVLPYTGMENVVMENLEFRMEDEMHAPFSILHSSLQIRPNPTEGLLFVQMFNAESNFPLEAVPLHLQVLNAQGQIVLSQQVWAENGQFKLDLSAGLASGLYYLVAQPEGGERAAVRFVLER